MAVEEYDFSDSVTIKAPANVGIVPFQDMLTDGDRPGILPHLIVFSICDDRQCHQTSSLSHFVREPFDGAAVDADRGWAMSVKGAYRQDDSIGPLEGLFSLLPGHIPETMFLHPNAPPPRNGRRQRAAAPVRQLRQVRTPGRRVPYGVLV